MGVEVSFSSLCQVLLNLSLSVCLSMWKLLLSTVTLGMCEEKHVHTPKNRVSVQNERMPVLKYLKPEGKQLCICVQILLIFGLFCNFMLLFSSTQENLILCESFCLFGM